MRVFLTGASGFIGSALALDLRDAGYQMMGLARSDKAAAALSEAGVEIQRGDLKDFDCLRRSAQQADAVIHAAFDHDFSNFAASCEMDRNAIDALGNALLNSEKPFIVTSGFPLMPGRSVTEDHVPPDGGQGMPRLSEQTALAFADRGVRTSIVRMSQVHNEGKQGFGSYLLAHAREKGVSAYVGDGLNRWPAVHRLDAARLYRLVLEKGVAGNRYHAVTEEGVFVRTVAEAIGRRLAVPVVSLAPEDSAGHFGWLDRIAQMDVPASSTLTRQRLGWRPSQPANLVANLGGNSL